MSIIVFSENYAASSWCLNELTKIMECRKVYGQVVVPVFYDVDPSMVRHQRGRFGKNLEACTSKFGKEYVLSNWRRALTEAASLAGWDVNSFR